MAVLLKEARQYRADANLSRIAARLEDMLTRFDAMLIQHLRSVTPKNVTLRGLGDWLEPVLGIITIPDFYNGQALEILLDWPRGLGYAQLEFPNFPNKYAAHIPLPRMLRYCREELDDPGMLYNAQDGTTYSSPDELCRFAAMLLHVWSAATLAK